LSRWKANRLNWLLVVRAVCGHAKAENLSGCARAHGPWCIAYPDAFKSDVPNPWREVTKNRRTKAIKPAVTRDDVYVFANTAIAAG
jgi:hypothetical protein